VIDNIDPGFSTEYLNDPWVEYVKAEADHYGPSHHSNHEIGTGLDYAVWMAEIPEPGRYEIYAWWYAGLWRPTDVPYTIYHRTGSTVVRVDQTQNGGQWNLLGSFELQDLARIEVSDDASSGRDIVADAVRIVYVEPLPTVTPTITPTPSPTPTGVWTPPPTDEYAWGDSNGLGTLSNVSFDWQEIEGATSTGVSADDGVYGPFPIGFEFEFFGSPYTSFYVSPNGWIGFSPSVGSIAWCSTLGSASMPDNMIAGFGGDRAVWHTDGGQISFKILGVAPQRSLVIQFTNVRYTYVSSDDHLDMQIILYEGSNGIQIQYANLTMPTTASVGIEGTMPDYPYRCYQDTCPAEIQESLAVRFAPVTD
jgi:hypothetical protein